MNRSDLIAQIQAKTSISFQEADQAVRLVFEAMSAALRRNEHIEIRGFGRFTVRHYREYLGRNPRRNAPMPVAPKRLPFFGPSSMLQLNKAGESEPI